MPLADCQKQIDSLLSLPRQAWLLGAGVSCDAGIPLMYPLTGRIEAMLNPTNNALFQTIRKALPDTAHVEQILSHIGDMLSLVDRSKDGEIVLDGHTLDRSILWGLHASIQQAIRDTVRWGYVPASPPNPEQVGTRERPIVKVDGHEAFVRALFSVRRAGLDRRPPVEFFTTNYDTLLEDALALCRIPTSDGFSGGAMAFWEPGTLYDNGGMASSGITQALVHKLHGSIDWFISDEDVVVRRRDGAGYPPETAGRLLIYPQSTKYQVTQRDPFASLFAAFRRTLTRTEDCLLAICGYSFGDNHVNEEIERALKQRGTGLTVVAFVRQNADELDAYGQGLPPVIVRWLGDSRSLWRDRIVVAGSHGAYHGNLKNLLPSASNEPGWWSFTGLTKLIAHGPEDLP